MSAPFAPWDVRGEAIVGFARWRDRPALPSPLRPLPGPCLVAATRVVESPVGPYLELSVAQPARLCGRPGWCLTLSVVDRLDARTGGRLNWGFPKELGALRWSARGDERELTWDDRDLVVRGRPWGPAVPVVTPLRALQHRGDGPVVVPGRFGGRFHLARVTVHAYPGDALAGLAGRHLGGVVTGVQLVMREARTPIGITATLRAPRRGAEPALLSDVPTGAYSSAG
ncbi:hypothetical protein BH20ACT2_BH20ACT2_03460 [soil metagenome]